jgi:hypothetical protein
MLSRRIRSAHRLVHLLDGVALDLDRQAGEGGAHGGERGRDPAGGDDVVVLHQRGVHQRHPVVDATAGPHRVLLERAQPGQCLAGVADRRARPVDRVRPGSGRRGDAGKMAEQVQRGAFGGQQAAYRAAYP